MQYPLLIRYKISKFSIKIRKRISSPYSLKNLRLLAKIHIPGREQAFLRLTTVFPVDQTIPLCSNYVTCTSQNNLNLPYKPNKQFRYVVDSTYVHLFQDYKIDNLLHAGSLSIFQRLQSGISTGLLISSNGNAGG